MLIVRILAVVTYVTPQLACLPDPEQPTYLTVIYADLPFTLAANLTRHWTAGGCLAKCLLEGRSQHRKTGNHSFRVQCPWLIYQRAIAGELFLESISPSCK